MGEDEDTNPIPDWCPLPDEKACPFCKSMDLVTTSNGEEQYNVLCNGCGTEGPTGINEEDAENMWNSR
jgi:transcription elongation factor Elf1